ncbi:phytanoyl-CoA dioxygenase family protein [Streptomyces sp. NPDC005533]|uniref:phytanoyl-CoA dioxygenase family protein n=1 Tax=Streptomyces sp. NPDC005533 TaxID=3364723 RepID=UPI003694A8FC
MTYASTRTVHDLYPTRGSEEVLTGRVDPVVWSEPGTPGPMWAHELESFERDGFLSVDELVVGAQDLPRTPHDARIGGEGREHLADPVDLEHGAHFAGVRLHDGPLVGQRRRVTQQPVHLVPVDVHLVDVHQSRINVKPGFGASGFYWHSDFETWHAEDGLPHMRTVSVSIALTPNHPTNGGLMIMPGSHRSFLGCAGATPKDNYKKSLQMQDAGTPSDAALTKFASACGIKLFTGKAGSATWFDCNAMHGSGDNITPFPRSNVFLVFNSVENRPSPPFAAPVRRPRYIASQDFTPVG